MRCYRKGLRVGVAVLFALLIGVHFWRNARKLKGTGSHRVSHGSAGSEISGSNKAVVPYQPRMVPVIHPSKFEMEKHPDGYDTFLWTDAFLKDERIYLISMVYVNTPRDHGKIVFKGKALPGSPHSPTVVHVRDAYESVIVAWFDAPGIGKLDRLDLDISYENRQISTTLLRAPGGWESGFAMCALFLQDKHLLRMWATYWYLLGIDTFYLYWNGDVKEIEELTRQVEDLPASITFISWQYDYWVPNKQRPHHGQPQAWNSCYHRNKDRHDFLVFYDLVRYRRSYRSLAVPATSFSPPSAPLRLRSELLVFENHTDLSSFYRSIPEPWTAMRSQSAWSSINLAALNATYDKLELSHVEKLPLKRARIWYEREKYVMNASCGIPVINVHGVYEEPTGVGFTGEPSSWRGENGGVYGKDEPDGVGKRKWRQLLLHASVAHHFHFVNVGRDRERDKYVDGGVMDSRAQETIRKQLETPRGLALKKKIALLEERRKVSGASKISKK